MYTAQYELCKDPTGEWHWRLIATTSRTIAIPSRAVLAYLRRYGGGALVR